MAFSFLSSLLAFFLPQEPLRSVGRRLPGGHRQGRLHPLPLPCVHGPGSVPPHGRRGQGRFILRAQRRVEGFEAKAGRFRVSNIPSLIVSSKGCRSFVGNSFAPCVARRLDCGRCHSMIHSEAHLVYERTKTANSFVPSEHLRQRNISSGFTL